MIMHDHQRRFLGSLNYTDFGLDHVEQRTFGTYDQTRHVERPIADELIQVVPAHSPPILWVSSENLLAVIILDARHLPVNLSLQARKFHLLRKALWRDTVEHRSASICQKRGQLDDVLYYEAVSD